MLAFLAAIAIQRNIFPFYSGDHDEPVYRFQAAMLQMGHINIPLAQNQFFRPWLSGPGDGHLVMAFSPGWPSVLMAANVTTGSMLVGLAGSERLAQLGDAHLQRRTARLRRLLAPQVVDEPVGRHDLVNAHQQNREQRALLGARQRHQRVAVGDFKRAEDPEVHRVSRLLADRRILSQDRSQSGDRYQKGRVMRLTTHSGLIATSLAIAALTAGGLFASASGAKPARAHVHAHPGAATVHVVEHAITDNEIPTGGGKDVKGNILTFDNPVFDAAEHRSASATTRASARGSRQAGDLGVPVDDVRQGGQITVEGPYYDTHNSVLSITGGTGAYRNARGEMVLKSRNGGKEYDLIFKLS